MSVLEFEINGNALFGSAEHKISILRCCVEWCSPDKHTENRTREYNSFHIVIGGRGILRYTAEGKVREVALQKGDSFVLYAGENYVYSPSAECPWGYGWIDFFGEEVEDLFSACGYSKNKPYRKLIDFNGAAEIFKNLIDSYDGSSLQGLKCAGHFMLLLAHLLRGRQAGAVKGETTKTYQRFREILIYIDNNYRRVLSVDKIAMDMCISPDYLKHLFSRMIDMSVTEYINRFRISSACYILKKSEETDIESVAAEVGYNDPKYFARVFKKFKGVSARGYQKNCKGDDPFLWLKEKNIDFR